MNYKYVDCNEIFVCCAHSVLILYKKTLQLFKKLLRKVYRKQLQLNFNLVYGVKSQ